MLKKATCKNSQRNINPHSTVKSRLLFKFPFMHFRCGKKERALALLENESKRRKKTISQKNLAILLLNIVIKQSKEFVA